MDNIEIITIVYVIHKSWMVNGWMNHEPTLELPFEERSPSRSSLWMK